MEENEVLRVGLISLFRFLDGASGVFVTENLGDYWSRSRILLDQTNSYGVQSLLWFDEDPLIAMILMPIATWLKRRKKLRFAGSYRRSGERGPFGSDSLASPQHKRLRNKSSHGKVA